MSEDKDDKSKKQQGSGRPGTKFMERPKRQGGVEDKGDEQYWGQGRQQKERDADQGKRKPSEN
jgi:hypothetical protein